MRINVTNENERRAAASEPSRSANIPTNPSHYHFSPTTPLFLLAVVGLFVAVVFVGENLCLYLLHQTSTLDLLRSAFKTNSAGDSWWPMMAAYQWFSHPVGDSVYQDVFFRQGIKFQYSPTSLLPFVAAEHAGIPISRPLLNRLGDVIFLIECGAVAALAFLEARRRFQGTDRLSLLCGFAVLAGIASVTFHPAVNALARGQIQTWINAAFALACVAWLVDGKFLAGMIIGGISLLKPQFGLFLLWGGLRREWTFVAGLTAVALAGLGASIFEFGWWNNVDYLRFLQFIGHRGEAGFDNQSVNGLLNRLVLDRTDRTWHPDAFAPYNWIVDAGTLISTCMLVGLALFLPRGKKSSSLFDFEIAALSFTIASPIAWEDHFGILPPIFVSLFFAAISQQAIKSQRVMLIALAGSFALATNRMPFAAYLALTPASLLSSYLFFSALVLLSLLYYARHALPQTAVRAGDYSYCSEQENDKSPP